MDDGYVLTERGERALQDAGRTTWLRLDEQRGLRRGSVLPPDAQILRGYGPGDAAPFLGGATADGRVLIYDRRARSCYQIGLVGLVELVARAAGVEPMVIADSIRYVLSARAAAERATAERAGTTS